MAFAALSLNSSDPNENKPERCSVEPDFVEESQTNYEKDVEFASSLPSDFEFGVDFGVRRSTVFGTMINTISTVIGAGVLSLPYTIAQTGYVIGVILFVASAIVTQWGLCLLFDVMQLLGGDQLSFGRVSERVNKTWLPVVVNMLVLLISLAITVLFLTISANFTVLVALFFYQQRHNGHYPVETPWYLTRMFLLSLPFFLVSMPLSLPKKVTILQYTSSIAFLTIIYCAIVVLYYTTRPVNEVCSHFMDINKLQKCVDDKCCLPNDRSVCCIGSVESVSSSFSSFISVFPVIATSLCCSPQSFNMWNDLKNPSVRRMTTGTCSALAVTVMFYILIGFCGYFTYGNSVTSDLLGSYPLSTLVTIARLGIALHTTLCFPLVFCIGRDSLLHIVEHVCALCPNVSLSFALGSRAYNVLWWSIVVLLLAIIYGLAILNIDIVVLLNLSGSISVANLSFTLPGVLYLSIMTNKKWTLTRISCVLLIILGIFTSLTNIVLWSMK